MYTSTLGLWRTREVLGAKGALLMFDLTRPMTLENLHQWVELCRKGDSNLPILFVGTKIDLVNDIMVNDDYALSFKEQFALFDFLKISSKSGENVLEAFEILTRKVLERQTY